MAACVLAVYLVCVALTVLRPILAAQCMPDQYNPCISRCNGTKIDIPKIFEYPVRIEDGRGYYYLWSPCDVIPGYMCPENRQNGDCAVCQKADQFYNCGHRNQPIYLWEQYEPVQGGFVFKIQYPWGVDWRISEFTFLVNEKQDKPTVTFTGESPYLQYNFLVTGKCIGQPSYECDHL